MYKELYSDRYTHFSGNVWKQVIPWSVMSGLHWSSLTRSGM